MLLRLPPDRWINIPQTPIELHADHDTMLQRDRDGIWHLELVRGVLLARIVLPDGRRLWPWPITPLPVRLTRPDAAHRLAAALGWEQVPEFSEQERRELDEEFEAAQADARRRYGLPPYEVRYE